MEMFLIQENFDDFNSKNFFNICWICDKWWKLVIGKVIKFVQIIYVNKLVFEFCVFDCIVEELSIGDLYIFYSEIFDDYWEQMISWE